MAIVKLVVLVCLLGLVLGCALGSSIPVGEKYKPTKPQAIQIVTEIPEGAKVIGLVAASSANEKFALTELKRQAAILGADAVMLETLKLMSHDNNREVQLSGKALKLNP